MNNLYTIFLNMTKNCNFRCNYCYEKETYNNNYLLIKDAEIIVDFINKILKSEMYNNNKYSGILIIFFGGEPTLNEFSIKYIVDAFKDNDQVFYSIVTNGSKLNVLHNIFDSIKTHKIGNMYKTHIQVSYDGYPVHDMSRLDINGKPTGDCIRKNIRSLMNDGYNVTTKSVITPDTFKYMPDAYLDMLDLNNNMNYFPTIDYYTNYPIGYKIEELEEALLQIAPYEIDYYKKNNRFFLTWFWAHNNHICAAGKDTIGIDMDLNIYPCEGSFFIDEPNHLIGNIQDDDILQLLSNRRKQHLEYERQHPSCSTCQTTTCFKCNMIKYNLSNKQNYFDRWYDYTDQEWLCKYYNVIGKVKLAIYNILHI